MKIGKRIAIALSVYIVVIATFESLIGFFQPAGGTTLVITTADRDGNTNDRVLARLDSDGKLYVAANHWPRAWYSQALENPKVEATFDGEKGAYLAAQVSKAEHDRLSSEHDTGFMFRVLTGFPPRYFLRLDPRPEPSAIPTRG